MERTKNWYSVIRYMPSELRGEVLNVGLMLHDPDSGDVKYQILDSMNEKLRAILANEVLQETYKVQRDYIDYSLKTVPVEETLLDPDAHTNDFLIEIAKIMPKEFSLSEPTFSKTNNKERLFKSLLETYIGEEFLDERDISVQVNAKKLMKQYFNNRNLLGTKVKLNAKFSPIKNINNVQFTIDFIYKNGVINFLQTAPSNKAELQNWFAKLNTLLEYYREDSKLYLFYDQKDVAHQDATLHDMIKFLKKKDSRVDVLEVNSNDFVNLCNKIEAEGKDIEEFEKELSA
ncbi:hypothetical protein COF68_15540 [Bacillus toyonensis]|uniref:DUF3037 domain-containing protein n=1 Tax=Bacillus toyonensis TaxID=155322 RepID=UPI000BFE5691|nr:DUF3037 domain-containing protein [Bacillus toyonensis]PHE61841.1 hypothetical protein COF68_15540 [Bacillus toyonensis]